MARYTSSLVNSSPSTMSRLVALGLNKKTEPENSSQKKKKTHNKWCVIKWNKWFSPQKKTQQISLTNDQQLLKKVSPLLRSPADRWQTFAHCPTMLFWHPVCQHVCDCMNAHGVPESIRDNTTHSLSCSRLSPTSAHIQHDCLTKVSEKLKISPRAESILANCHFLLNWLLLFTNLSK